MTQTIPLHHYMDARIISVQSKVSSRKTLLQEMARLLALPLQDAQPREEHLGIEKDVYHALLEREKLGNTGIGNGVAMPHSRFAQTNEAIVAVITIIEPIDYDSPDRQAVDVAFGLIVPTQASEEHLHILANIARVMSEAENKKQLNSATSSEQAIKLIESWA